MDENEMIDEKGSFKSLGDQLEYFGEFPTNIPKEQGAPNPFEYPPGSDKKFDEDLSSFKQKKLVQEAVREVLPQTPQEPIIESLELRKEIDENEKFAKLEREIVLLGESRLDSERWHDPIVQREFGDKVHAWNQKNNQNVFLLPKESSEWGHTLPLRPGNMVIIEVPKEVAEEVRRAVYQGQGGYGGRNKFEALWATLNNLGYSSGKKPTILFPEQSKESEKEPTNQEDRWGSQKKFEEWRMKQGARR